MKRVLRDVVVGAVSAVATVGAGAGAFVAFASDALAQDGSHTGAPPQGAAAAPGAVHAVPAATPAPTRTAQVTAPSAVIRRVVVEGNQRIEPSTVTSYLLVHPGDTFDPERIDLSLKTLFATGLFADVQISQRESDLVVSVNRGGRHG